MFANMLEQEKKLGAKICKMTIDGVPDVRIGLDEIPDHVIVKFNKEPLEDDDMSEFERGE